MKIKIKWISIIIKVTIFRGKNMLKVRIFQPKFNYGISTIRNFSSLQPHQKNKKMQVWNKNVSKRNGCFDTRHCICENISCQITHSLFWRFWCNFWANKLNWLFYWHNTYKEFVPVPVCPGTGSDRFQETRLSGSEPESESPTQKVFRPTKDKPQTNFRLDCKRNTWLWMFLDFISAIFDMLCIAVWKILNIEYRWKVTCKDYKH